MGRLKLEKPIFNLSVLRGALALACLTVGANIAFGSITGGIAGASQNVDHLTIYSGLADAVSALFGERACGGDHLRNGGRAPSRYGGCADDGHHGRHSVLRPAAQDR
ncbi:MAG: hypothetical protein ACLR7U_03035 [Ruthenibacterium lactatiformans]